MRTFFAVQHSHLSKQIFLFTLKKRDYILPSNVSNHRHSLRRPCIF